MKTIQLLAGLALAVASSGASANSLTFQNVTFSSSDLGSGELQLTITNALSANGDWAGIKYLEAFDLDSVGTFTSASLTGWTYKAGGLSNGSATGCNGNGTGDACFYQSTTPLTLTNNMVFDIFFTGGTTDFSSPHLKIDFWAALGQSKSTGNLLSENIDGLSPVPLPAALPLFTAGLGAIGLLGWRRKRRAAAIAA